MATVIFYEKPGCQGNLRQKTLLAAAGHQVEARNLKNEAWTAERLLAFLGKLPVAEWFNRSAPLVKSGEIVPENLGFEHALHLLLDNPLLIRRPLMEVDRGSGCERLVGFDLAAVDAWIGLQGVSWPESNIEACAHSPAQNPCGQHAHPDSDTGHAAHDAQGAGNGRCSAH